MPVGTDLQVVRDEHGVRIVDTASGQSIIARERSPARTRPLSPTTSASAKTPSPVRRVPRSAASPDGTWHSSRRRSAAPRHPPADACCTPHRAPTLLSEPWLDTDALPPLPFVGDPPLPPRHSPTSSRTALPCPGHGNLWTTMKLRVQRESSSTTSPAGTDSLDTPPRTLARAPSDDVSARDAERGEATRRCRPATAVRERHDAGLRREEHDPRVKVA